MHSFDSDCAGDCGLLGDFALWGGIVDRQLSDQRSARTRLSHCPRNLLEHHLSGQLFRASLDIGRQNLAQHGMEVALFLVRKKHEPFSRTGRPTIFKTLKTHCFTGRGARQFLLLENEAFYRTGCSMILFL